MVTLAIVSMLRHDDPLRRMVDFALEHGFKAMELHGKKHNAESLSDGDVDYLASVAATDRLVINHHFHHDALPGSHRASTWDQTLASFERNIELVHRVGGDVIVLHPGKIDAPTLRSPEDASELIRREAQRNLRRFVETAAPTAKRSGVTICIENMKHAPGDVLRSYADLAGLVDAIGSEHLGVALDVGHCIIGDGLPQAIEVFGNRIKHLHLNDAIDGVEHMEIGIGELDLDELSPLLDDGLGIRYATLEVGSRDPDGDGIVLRSRDVLRLRFGTAIA